MNYFVCIDLPNSPWMRVTEQEFTNLAQNAGFRRPVASFSGGGIKGTTTTSWPTKYDDVQGTYVRNWNVMSRNDKGGWSF